MIGSLTKLRFVTKARGFDSLDKSLLGPAAQHKYFIILRSCAPKTIMVMALRT